MVPLFANRTTDPLASPIVEASELDRRLVGLMGTAWARRSIEDRSKALGRVKGLSRVPPPLARIVPLIGFLHITCLAAAAGWIQ